MRAYSSITKKKEKNNINCIKWQLTNSLFIVNAIAFYFRWMTLYIKSTNQSNY